jgi:uncharacterized protein (DUF362 family)
MNYSHNLSRRQGLSRRDLIAGSAGAIALNGCSRAREPTSLVSITRSQAYSQDLYETVRRILTHHKLNLAGKRIVVKPNLVEFDASTCINSHPTLVHAVYEAAKSMGAANVRIAEGPGHRRTTMELAEAAGYFDTVPGFEDLFTDLNLDDVSLRKLIRPVSKLRELYLPNTILDADLVISVPKMKTHHWVGATLSMKNFFGVVPGAIYGWPKNVLHWAGIDGCIMDLHGLFPNTFAVVDGIIGMEGNGPIQGKPKQAGVLVAGRDLAAVDATCCRVMGIDPDKVAYISGTQRAKIEQIGEQVAAVKQNFELSPEFSQFRLT